MFGSVVAGVLTGILNDQVIGGHDYRPIDQFLEQSTAQRLADEVSTPLLVLPPAEAS